MNPVVRVGILTVSDRCSRGEAEDTAGPALADLIEGRSSSSETRFPENWKVTKRECVPDEIDSIRGVLLKWCDSGDDGVHLALTTGGTGFAARDVTPEATAAVIERAAPGLVHQMMAGSLRVTPLASLSRLTAGVRGRTVVLNLPGSRKGAAECLGFVAKALPHAVDLLLDRKADVTKTHHELQGHHCHHHHGGASSSNARHSSLASRPRQSPFPMISVEEAQSTVLKYCGTLGDETVVFEEALGRVLAEDVAAREPLPPFPASIKDGYAILASDGVGVRTVIDPSEGEPGTAGVAPAALPNLRPGTCLRVNTGAPVPLQPDVAVLQVEDTKLVEATKDGEQELKVEMLTEVPAGNDIRPTGCDIRKGQIVLKYGTVVAPAEVGLLATVGATRVKVHKLPIVGLLSTGNELQDPATDELRAGAIRDSNKSTLRALLRTEGIPFADMGIARDDFSELGDKLESALSSCDLLVTTGGVSMGDRDILRQVLQERFNAKIHFARVEMKPGKPTTFATLTLGDRPKLVLGLPGNPVSATVTATLYVLPACRKMSGHTLVLPERIRARLPCSVRLDPRPEYARCVLQWKDKDPVADVALTGNQISSRLLSCVAANGLLLLPGRTDGKKELVAGEIVDAIMTAPVRRRP